MGIKIREILPAREITLDDLRGKVIAVDFFNVVYQFLASIRMADGTPLTDSHGRITSHLQGLLNRTVALMEKGIKLVFVFDGKPHPLKFGERERRLERKAVAHAKYEDAVAAEDVTAMGKYAKQKIRITSEIIEESKQLLEALGLPVVQAPCEGEAQAAYMVVKGDCWAVASQDADVLLFGSSRLIRNLTLSQKRKVGSRYVQTYIELITLQDVLHQLHITFEQLIYLGILIGTDFNPGGVSGIGPKKGLKIVREKKPEEMFGDSPWQEIAAVFHDHPVTDSYTLQWKSVNRNKVYALLVGEHDFDEQRVASVLDRISRPGQKGLADFF